MQARGAPVHGGAVVGDGSQDRRHDGPRADGIHTDVVRRQRERHAPAERARRGWHAEQARESSKAGFGPPRLR